MEGTKGILGHTSHQISSKAQMGSNHESLKKLFDTKQIKIDNISKLPFMSLIYENLNYVPHYRPPFFTSHECYLHSLMASLPSLSLSSTNPLNPKLNSFSTTTTSTSQNTAFTKRHLILKTTSLCFISLASQHPLPYSLAEPSPPSKTALSGIANTKSWFQFYGDGFAIRVPPQFEDIMEPEDFNAGLSLYGDKAKPKTFAARFASADGSEVLSVVVRPSNQLKITFLEAKDITNFGSLKEAAKIFVPGGSTLYSARTIKIKEEEGFKTYYFYEFGKDEQHVALVAAVNSGKTIIAGATAPESKWDDDGVKLRSAAISLTLL